MTQRADLMLSSSQIPDQYTDPFVGRLRYRLVCGKLGCENTESWESPSPGFVRPHRILAHFRRRGWGIGRDRAGDVCPTCLMAERAVRNARAAAKLKLVQPELPAMSTTTVMSMPPPAKVALRRVIVSHTPVFMPGFMDNRHWNTRAFGVEDSAARSASDYLKARGIANPKRGTDFVVRKNPAGGWDWDATVPGLVTRLARWRVVPFPDFSAGRNRVEYVAGGGRKPFEGSDFVYPPDNKDARKRNDGLPTRGMPYQNALRHARTYHRHLGRQPHEGVTFRRFRDDQTGLWGWELIEPLDQEQPAMNANPAAGNGAKPPPSADELPLHAEPPPQPTRAQNREIHDFLDKHYDDGAQRWRGDYSDRKAADEKNVPRAWVTKIREEFFGPDRNEAQAIDLQKITDLGQKISDVEMMHAELGKDIAGLKAQQARLLEGRGL